MVVRLLCLLYVLLRVDNSPVGVLPAVCRMACDLETSKQRGLAPVWAVAPQKKNNPISLDIDSLGPGI